MSINGDKGSLFPIFNCRKSGVDTQKFSMAKEFPQKRTISRGVTKFPKIYKREFPFQFIFNLGFPEFSVA